MKTIVILLLSCFMFTFCQKKNNLDEARQDEEKQISQNAISQEEQKANFTYVFDIDSFKFLEEFPGTIEGIKAMYPDEPFEVDISENDDRFSGSYFYGFKSSNITFYFNGNTMEDAKLYEVDIFNPEYQCKSIQVIGMNVSELESVSGEKLKPENNIRIYSEKYILVIETQDNIVSNYWILLRLEYF